MTKVKRLVSGLRVAGLADQQWTMQDGTLINVGDMSERHAKNCLRMLMRSVDAHNEHVIMAVEVRDNMDYMFDEHNDWGNRDG